MTQGFDALNMVPPLVEPQDVPVHLRHYAMTETDLTQSDKLPFAYARGTAQKLDCFEMIRDFRGLSDAEFAAASHCYTIINTNSPRQIDIPMALGLIDFARAGQLCIVTPFTLMEAKAPITVAGALTLSHAEAAHRGRRRPAGKLSADSRARVSRDLPSRPIGSRGRNWCLSGRLPMHPGSRSFIRMLPAAWRPAKGPADAAGPVRTAPGAGNAGSDTGIPFGPADFGRVHLLPNRGWACLMPREHLAMTGGRKGHQTWVSAFSRIASARSTLAPIRWNGWRGRPVCPIWPPFRRCGP